MFDTPIALGFDYDGVIADSRETAFAVTEQIAMLFDMEVSVTTMSGYRRAFDEIESRYAPEPTSAEALRTLHRLMMRARAASVPLFEPVLALVGRITIETVVITSALRATVLSRIGERLGNVHGVLGHEEGLKEHNMAAWSKGRQCVYVTDNIRDIKHCRASGVAVIAVGWGFDSKQDLLQAEPDWYVGDMASLKSLLEKLNLIS